MSTEFNNRDLESISMNGKKCIVTGANSGIGKETTVFLAQMDAHVIMVCRSEKRGKKAMNEIREKNPKAQLDLMLCDLSSFSEVRSFAEKFKANYNKLDLLINNAGVYLSNYTESEDGVATMMAVNHFSPFLLTHLLLPILKQSSPSKIINVNSGAHRNGEISLEEVGKIEKWPTAGWRGYATTKFVNLLTIYKFAEKLNGSEVTINAYNPGMTKTNLPRHSLGAKIMWKLISLFIKSAKEGAEPLVYLAVHPEMKDISGKYFDQYEMKKSSPKSYDKELQEEVWRESLKVTGLEP
jgi:NAD(P)-dependent dehydrogenase (short-subunit alcohol dehydrogenase family)